MAQYGHEVYGQFETLMAVDGDPAPIDFHREGYLWLGSGVDDVDALIANWRIQTAHDVHVELLDRKGVKHRFPSIGSTISTSPHFRPTTATWTRTAC
jgi:FAD-dependent oxidoreductase domain-containing protein 1